MGAKSADRGFGRGLAFHGFAAMVVPELVGNAAVHHRRGGWFGHPCKELEVGKKTQSYCFASTSFVRSTFESHNK